MRAWFHLHGAHRGFWLGLAGFWAAAVVLSGVGLPWSLTDYPDQSDDLNSFGLIAVAAAAGYSSLALEDQHPWPTATATRRLWWWRALWWAAVCVFSLSMAAVASLALPPAVPRLSAFVAVGALSTGLAGVACALAGRYAGMLLPFCVVVVMSSRFVPWSANVVFRSDTPGIRVWLAAGLMVAAALSYTALGSATTRRRLRAS